MRILIATPHLPWPLSSGGNAAQFSTLKCLAQDHQFTLVAPVYNQAGLDNAHQLQSQLPQVVVRAVFCGKPTPPKPRLVIRAARAALGLGRRCLSPSGGPARPATGEGALVYPFAPLPDKLIHALEDELGKGVDICQAEFASFMPLGAWFPRHIPKLFVHHQIHYIYAERFARTHGADPHTRYLQAVMHTQELAFLRQFQGIITFSEEDRRALLPELAPERLFTSPFPLPSDMEAAASPAASFDGRFLFLASEENPPNRDALKWLLAEIWPEIRQQLPSAHLVVVGYWSEAAQADYAAPGVRFAGFVSDLAATLRGGIMLVPLRVGSGIRVKIMAALAQGVPVVSTTVGSEGMPLRDGKELLVRDGASEFAQASAQLARDPDLWRKLSAAGRLAMVRHYSPGQVRQRRNEIYKSLRAEK